MKSKHPSLLLSILLGLTLLAQSCSYNKETDRRQLNVVSTKEEIKIGRQADPSIQQQFGGPYQDSAIQNYVTSVGNRVAAVTKREGITYSFTVLDSPIINAFALPGGYLYITRGTLALMNSEAELAFVLGHEIGHVTGRHGAERYTQAQGLQVLNTGLKILVGEDFNAFEDVVNTSLGLAITGYGRRHEFESDLLGVDYTYNAGYDPKQGARFLHALKKLSKSDPNWLEKFISSHPPTDERITRAENRILEITSTSTQNKTLVSNKDGYLDIIENIIIGPKTAKGEVTDKNHYYNYQLGITFKLPKHWTPTANQPGTLLTFKPKLPNYTGTLTKHKKSKQLSFKEQINRIELKEELTKLNSESDTSIYTARYQGYRPQSGLITIQKKFINTPKAIWELSFSTPENAKEFFKTSIDLSLKSLRKLTSKDYKDVQFYKLKIITVQKGDTLKSLAKKHLNTPEEANRIASFNDLPDNTPITPGQRLKLPPKFKL